MYKLAITGVRSCCVRLSMGLGVLLLSVAVNASDRTAQITPGDMAPDFTLPILVNPSAVQIREADNTDSKFALLKLSDYRGKVVYLDFWQASCAPCRESLPLLSKHRDEFATRGIEILGVNTDVNPRDALSLIAKFALNYPVVSDPGAQVASRFGLRGLPTAYLIARDGTVHQVREGFEKQDMKDIRATLYALSGNPLSRVKNAAFITKIGN